MIAKYQAAVEALEAEIQLRATRGRQLHGAAPIGQVGESRQAEEPPPSKRQSLEPFDGA